MKKLQANAGGGIVSYLGTDRNWFNNLLVLGTFNHKDISHEAAKEGIENAWEIKLPKNYPLIREGRDMELGELLGKKAGYQEILTFRVGTTDFIGKSEFGISLIKCAPNIPPVMAVIDYYRQRSLIPYKYFLIIEPEFDSIEIRTNKGYEHLNRALFPRLERAGFVKVV